MDTGDWWIPATIAAAAAQTARNATQHGLTATLGTAGASYVRFLYGLPWALVFLTLVVAAMGPAPAPSWRFVGFVTVGAVAQIAATVAMLAAMRAGSFAVTTAFTKTEPVQVALFGLVVLGDRLSAAAVVAILVGTAGIMVLARPATGAVRAGPGPVLLGLVAGAGFGIAAVGFRGGILALDSPSFLLAATTALAWSLALQTGLLLAWLLASDRATLRATLVAWRPSMLAGALGALASQLWFIGFALTAAANVRTLALVEVLFAAVVSRRLLRQAVSGRQGLGLGLVIVAVALLLLGG